MLTDAKAGTTTPAKTIVATITPRTLTRADIFVLRMIKDNTGRPIYFSRTSGGYGSQELGLGPYLITQGLARKLVPEEPYAGIVPSTFATGHRYALLGYTTVVEAATPPLAARHTLI